MHAAGTYLRVPECSFKAEVKLQWRYQLTLLHATTTTTTTTAPENDEEKSRISHISFGGGYNYV